MIDSLQAVPDVPAPRGAIDEDSKHVRASGKYVPAVVSFLEAMLAGGAVTVASLEVRARAAGLLGERQKITDAKRFKAAKKKLGINSRRDGFGRGGEWFWSLPTQPSSTMGSTAVDVPVAVIYGEGHTRPTQRHAVEPSTRPSSEDAWIERAQDNVIPSEWIDGVARLAHQCAPNDIPPHRWRQFVNDCHIFLCGSKGWAKRAAKLGWDSVSLFGCRPARPLEHLGDAGLLWRLAGGALSAIHKDWAALACVDGTPRVFHRRPGTRNVTLPWLPR
jgi:hypothetical protein